MSKDIDLGPVIRRLDVIINLLFKLSEKEDKEPSAKSKIVMLDSLGLKPSEIAKMVGKSENYVNVQLSLQRKEKKTTKSDEEVAENE